ncbi:MAG: helix-turn-helix domain-containing protein [Acidimicrobiaceae bacterium]|nr:helix-turn-helix domain-containing protein [Acidimicrobiaceae bacterium]
MEVLSVVRRLSFDERARIEAMQQAGVSAAGAARCLGRDPGTIYRELRRAGGRAGGYDAVSAQAAADTRAARAKTANLAADPELAEMVRERLAVRWPPHAICADLRAEGRRISAETIYAACYDHTGRRGLPEGSWRLLPRRCRRRKPQGRGTRKPGPLGDFKATAARPSCGAGGSSTWCRPRSTRPTWPCTAIPW